MCWICSVSTVKYTQNFWQLLGWISGFRQCTLWPSCGFCVCYIHITLYYRFQVLNFLAKYCTLRLPFTQWQSYWFLDHTLNIDFCSILICFDDLPCWTSLRNIVSHESESKSKSSPFCDSQVSYGVKPYYGLMTRSLSLKYDHCSHIILKRPPWWQNESGPRAYPVSFTLGTGSLTRR